MFRTANPPAGQPDQGDPSSKMVGGPGHLYGADRPDPGEHPGAGQDLTFPIPVIGYFKGMIGQPQGGGFPKELQKVVLRGGTHHLPPRRTPSSQRILKPSVLLERSSTRTPPNRDIIGYCLYPKVMEDFPALPGILRRHQPDDHPRLRRTDLGETTELAIEGRQDPDHQIHRAWRTPTPTAPGSSNSSSTAPAGISPWRTKPLLPPRNMSAWPTSLTNSQWGPASPVRVSKVLVKPWRQSRGKPSPRHHRGHEDGDQCLCPDGGTVKEPWSMKASRSKPANCLSPSSNPALPLWAQDLLPKEESQVGLLSFRGAPPLILFCFQTAGWGYSSFSKPVQQILL